MDELPPHLTNERTKGMPHEASNYRCWCVDDVNVLQQEVMDLRNKIEAREAEWDGWDELAERMRAKIERLEKIETAARNLDEHRNEGYATLVSYLIRLHEVLGGQAEGVGWIG